MAISLANEEEELKFSSPQAKRKGTPNSVMKTLNKKHDFSGLVDQQIFYDNPYKDDQIP